MNVTNAQTMDFKNPFDSWKSIAISLYMTLIGYGVLVGIPVISTAWVTLLGFSEVEVGRVAGADLGGLSLGAVVTAIFVPRVSRRLLAIVGLSLAVIANFLCITIVDYDQVLWLRLLAGFGSGIYTAVAVSSLGASSKPARAYNAMLFAFAFSQALEMHFLPLLSMAGIYKVFIVCFLLTIPFIKWIPAYSSSSARQSESMAQESSPEATALQGIPAYVPWLCLFAIVVAYINIGAYWTYIELAALADKADPEWIGQVLTWSSLCSIVGCLFATVLSNRYGLLRPLLVTLLTVSVIVGMLVNGITDTTFFVSVFAFTFLWIFNDVYQMSIVANVDKSGRFAALLPGAQGLGQIIGPNVAASILALNLGYSGVFLMCAAAAFIALLIYGFMYFRFKQTIPALAYAT
jgi:MFS family permease